MSDDEVDIDHLNELYDSGQLEIDDEGEDADANGHRPDRKEQIDLSAVEISPTLFDDIGGHIRRFVVMADDQLIATALWVLHTHAIDAAVQTPYLAVTSAEKGCGKSRLIEVLELLVRRPWFVIGPSEAVLFRKIHKDEPTVLIDEYDTIYPQGKQVAPEHEGVRQVLNAGHRRGASVPRCLGRSGRLQEFRVFGPKLLSGIGQLPSTVADRSLPIRLERKRKSEPVERFRRREQEQAAYALRDQAAAWAWRRMDELRDARPEMPDELSDRMQEGCELLVAIADRLDVGGEARMALVSLCTGDRLDDDDSLRLQLLRDTKRVFAAVEKRRGGRLRGMHTKLLVLRLRRLEESPWRTWPKGEGGLTDRSLAFLLHPYGIKSRLLRLGGEPKRGYRRSDLADLWGRYL